MKKELGIIKADIKMAFERNFAAACAAAAGTWGIFSVIAGAIIGGNEKGMTTFLIFLSPTAIALSWFSAVSATLLVEATINYFANVRRRARGMPTKKSRLSRLLDETNGESA